MNSFSSGLTRSSHSAVITPASPAKADEIVNAPALTRATFTPIAVAAASLSRTARQDRPIRLCTAPRARK